ncbi:MAG TPA: ABC transporter substrate-binding protein, partial [Gaiellaceae bacterium]
MVRRRCAGALALVLALSLLAASNALAAGFPVTIATATGKVTIAKKPIRIVSLSPTATEDLFAIGAGPQVIAVDDQSSYPAAAPRTKLSGFTPNVEAIAAYRPDLVVGEAGLGKIVAALGKLNIPVLVQPTATRLTDAYAQLRQLGKATGHEGSAAALVARMKKQIAAAVASVPKASTALAVYHELDPTYYSATSKTFIGRVYSLLGLRNVADAADKTGSGYPQLSAEYIVAASPGLIVLADTKCCGQTAAKVAKRAGWGTIAAVEDGAVVEVSDDLAS